MPSSPSSVQHYDIFVAWYNNFVTNSPVNKQEQVHEPTTDMTITMDALCHKVYGRKGSFLAGPVMKS
jgi:hypothetical protein